MLVRPTAKDWFTALRVHRRFAARPGSEHIASRISLAYLSSILRQHDCKLALEFGAGIGTLTYLLLQKGLRVVALERNAFCLDQLKRNIPAEWHSRMTLITDRDDIDGVFDLVIIDGKLPRGNTYRFLRPGTICFAEGCRRDSTLKFQERMASAGLCCAMEHYEPWTRLRIKVRKTGIRVRRKKTCRVGIVSEKIL
jgi:hypothetical protein